jgi:lipoate-protein ligase A
VESLSCRLLPFGAADGPHNMAADEALLESAVSGVASLRFYQWVEATLSLGYFQPAAAHDQDRRLGKLPFVRRPTGGESIVHHFELTYALAVPRGSAWQGPERWLQRMHAIIVSGLAGLSVSAELHTAVAVQAGKGSLCFQHTIPGDVVIGGTKVVGSAQRRRKGALLQHGSILLTTSTFAPLLPGIRELSGHGLTAPPIRDAVTAEFARRTGWQLEPEDWTEPERRRIKELTVVKYTHDSWNRKR